MIDKTLRKMIIGYFSSEISQEKISQWAKQKFYDMLQKQEILEIEKMGYSHFLARISDVSSENAITFKKELQKISKVLNGLENYNYVYSIGMPREQRKKKLLSIFDIFEKYRINKSLPLNEIRALKNFAHNVEGKTYTVADLFSMQMRAYLLAGYGLSFQYDEMYYKLKSTLFFNGKNVNEQVVLKRIDRLKSCYLGQEIFYIYLEYTKGIIKGVLLV